MAEQTHIIRPKPRRPFELSPISTDTSTPSTPTPGELNVELLDSKLNGAVPPNKTRSFLNLTSSTLFGIYSDASRDEAATPWGTGAETPSFNPNELPPQSQTLAAVEARTNSKKLHHPHVSPGERTWSLFVRAVFLFAFGVAYGTVITHLQEVNTVAPVKVDGINRNSWLYTAFWGSSGVFLGNLLPWIDEKADEVLSSDDEPTKSDSKVTGNGRPENSATGSIEADWNPAVRGVGAFIGIAFAIRRLQWESTMQVSLTLALVNPCLWYMIDRTKTGFALSTVVGIFGTIGFLLVNPSIFPPPATTSGKATSATDLGMGQFITDESIGVATWIASVLFCSSVCFGNIGRRIALGRVSKST